MMDREAASELDGIDGVILRILGFLTTKERVRLAAVSKRWMRLALSDLRFAPYGAHVAQTIVRASDALVSLDIAGRGEAAAAGMPAARRGDTAGAEGPRARPPETCWL